MIGFHSQFWVEPTHKLTFLVSYNSQKSSSVARTELFEAFVDRYLPGPPPQVKTVKLSAKDLEAYRGYYSSSRRADSTKIRLFGLANARRVQGEKDGSLTISGASDLRGAPLHFVPVGSDTFFNEGEQAFLHFTRDEHGRVNGYVTPSHTDRVGLGMNPLFLSFTGGAAVLTLLLVLGAALVRTWRRLFQRRRPRLQPQPGTRWVPIPLQLAMWSVLAVAIDLFVILGHLANYTSFYQIGHLDRWFTVQNAFAGVALLLLVMGVLSGLGALRGRLRWITKVKLAVVVLSCCWFGWFFVYFHLLGSATHY